MYKNGEDSISIEEATSSANLLGLSVEQWAAQYGWSLEGKTTVPEETTPPTEPVKTTAAGDSSLADTSLESPVEIKPVKLNTAELMKEEEDVVALINEQISQYGLIAETSDIFGDAIKIRRRERKDDKLSISSTGGLAGGYVPKSSATSTPSISLRKGYLDGRTKDTEELLKEINTQVQQLADTNYLTKVAADAGETYDEFKKQMQPEELTDDEIKQAIIDVRNDKFTQLEKSKRVTGMSGGFVPRPDQKEIELQAEDFENGDEYFEYLDWKSDNVDVTPEQVKMFNEERKAKHQEETSRRLTNKMEDWERESIYALSKNEIEFFKQESVDIAAARKDYDFLLNNYETAVSNFEQKEDKTQEDLYKLLLAQSNLMDKANSLNPRIKRLQSFQSDEAAAAAWAITDASKEYNRFNQLASNFKSAIVPQALYLLGQAYGGLAKIEEGSGESGLSGKLRELEESTKAAGLEMKETAAIESASFQRSPEFTEIGSTSDLLSWVAASTTSLIPSLTMAATGPAALPLFFVSGAGEAGLKIEKDRQDAVESLIKYNAKYGLQYDDETNVIAGNEEWQSMDSFDRININKELTEAKRALNITQGKQLLTQALYGTAETVFERYGTVYLINKLQKGISGISAKTLKEGFVKGAGALVTAKARESASEVSTLAVDNFADIYLLGEDKNIFDGWQETAAQGALMGGVLSGAPKIIRDGWVSEMATKQQEARLQEIKVKLGEVLGIDNLVNTEVGDILDSFPKEAREMAEELISEADGIKDNILEGLAKGEFTIDQLFQIGEANRKMRKANSEMMELVSSGMGAAELKAAVEEKRKAFNEAQQEKYDILEGADATQGKFNQIVFENETAYRVYGTQIMGTAIAQQQFAEEYSQLNKKQKQKLLLEAKLELENQGAKDISEENIAQEARAIYVTRKLTEKFKSGKKNAISYAKERGLNVDFIERDNNDDIKKVLEQLKNANRISEKDYNAALKQINQKAFQAVNFTDRLNNAKDIIVVNSNASISKGQIGVYAHEILHSEIKNLIKSKGKDVTAIASEFLNYLEQNFPDTHTMVLERVQAGAQEDGAVDLEEAMTAFSDLLALGNKVDIDVIQQIRLVLNKLTGKNTFKSGISTFRFIRDFNKAAHYGGKATFTSSVRRSGVLPDDVDEAAFSRIKSPESQSLYDTIQAVQPKGALSKSAFQSDPGFTELYMLLQPGAAIHNFVVSKFPGQAEKVREIIESLEERLINFDPAKKRKGSNEIVGSDGFVEFIMANINFATLDANKKLAIEAARQKTTTSADTEGAQQIADTAAPVVESVKEKTEYKDLLRRKIVDQSVVDAISQKVLRTVSLLKSKIDAKVSKNVTVTPIIREIKKEIGKQADIDLKTAMGGKKDGELRKFLLRNKAAILENMSTTWLSQAMPFAVQKKVEGEWTTDWKGKKVDREAMSTDLAGRTSGAELVRRVPKGSTRISDAEFLAAVVDSKGAPLRGKKESLAKAIAEEITFDIIKKSFDENGPIAQALIENQKRNGVENAENMGPEFKRQAERGNVKFSGLGNFADIKQSARDYEILDQQAISERLQITKNAVNKFLGDNGIEEIYNFSVERDEDGQIVGVGKGVVEYVEHLKDNVVPLHSKSFWFRTTAIKRDKRGNIISGGENELYTPLMPERKSVSKELTQEEFVAIREYLFKEIRDNKDFINYGPEIQGLTERDYRASSYNTLIGTAQNARKNIKKIKAHNKRMTYIHRRMWERFSEAIEGLPKDDITRKNTIRAFATFLSMSTVDKKHPQRQGAAISGWSKNFVAGKTTGVYEHTFPNISVIQGLLEAAVNNNDKFSTYYNYISQNYRVIALNKEEDDKVSASFRGTMPINYDIVLGNWWDRYFNPITAQQQDGIDPGSIELLNGQTLAQVANVRANGTPIDINRFENIIDNLSKNNLAYQEELIELFETIGSEEKFFKKLAGLNEKYTNNVTGAIRKDAASFSAINSKYGDIKENFNKILERDSGIDFKTQMSRTRGQILGKDKGRFKFFIAPGADDFRGLVHYAFSGQGKQGEEDMKFFEDVLLAPYFKGIAVIDSLRQQIKREFKVVTKEFKDEYAMLSEPVPGTPFTYDHAVRVYMWGLAGTNIPGLSDKDRNDLENAILDNPALADLAEALLIVGRREAWPKPSEFWLGDSVLSDLNSMTEKVGRKEILAQFIENVDAMFDEATLNKIEAIKGRKHREALEDSIYAMKNGSNRPSGANIQTNKWINWINGSTGAIMFFNRRSALLQMLSFTNFINWSDNNPIKAAAAFANQKQYWKDFVFIFNSDKLKERRGGLKQDVSESEIAQVAGRSKNSPQAILAYMLKIGFTPTQIADSFAIATGGAGFYRNRVNTYLKEGLSQKKAEEKAFEDFSKASDVAQQSSDPALVSQQQRSILGRFLLAFANTPMQYTRLMKKAGQDLINGRGDAKEHISKILYYGFIQNFIFSALQSAMFGLFFDDEEDDEIRKKNADKKLLKTVNSMVDTVLRGSGVYGAVLSTIKNTIQQYYTQEGRGFMADHAYTLLSAFNVSPPIGSKFRKLYTAIQTKRFEEDAIAARGWAITANGRVNLGPNWAVLGSLVSGAANVPLDRVYDEINSISEALDARNKAWQRIALALGWKTWDVGVKNEEHDLIETLAKEKRKKEGIEKRKKTVRKKKEALDKKLELMSPQERTEYERNKKK